ncbi:polysaccharide deacetylase family protein [Thioalkalivibrio sulfidiphilus]|uniref:polysaccharide deacetylase family protein n=1 Tax=Thioalkalivibrio sulfidiphilus TaxID=1033854 RepID=UPI00036D2FA2|nr:polysaccharide deacetylase family protein [Thioalkalivibrio sulfidiphilus]
MVVSPETFRKHIQWIGSEYELMGLGEWIERAINKQTLPDKACCITFDDGWQDNYEFAFPILKETETPATIFAVSHMIGTQELFWPNRLARILVHEELKNLRNDDRSWLMGIITFQLGVRPTLDQVSGTIANAKEYDDNRIQDHLNSIEDTLNISHAGNQALADWGQLREMSNSGLVEVGSHTRYHTRILPSLSEEAVSAEILGSKHLLQEQLNRPIRLFCYPNGDVTDFAKRQVEAHYEGAVTTQIGINRSDADVYAIKRMAVHDDISGRRSDLFARLSGWL